MPDRIDVLLVEDNDGDAGLIEEYLSGNPAGPFRLQRADRLSAALNHIAAGQFDVVLLDLGLPDSHGLETLAQVRAHAPSVPVIVITGFSDREFGVLALQQGASDYFVKGTVDAYLLAKAVLRQIKPRQKVERSAPTTDR